MACFFITGSGTGVGKTLVTTALCRQFMQAGKKITALKPVISGYDFKDLNNDAVLILQSCGIVPSAATVNSIAPWRYAAPLAPSMAAAKEGHPVDMEALVQFCRDAASASDITLVEGVGGVMSPLTDRSTVLDWMEALGWPAVLISGSYLGALSHTLASFEALKSRNVRVRGVVVCESKESGVPLADTAGALEKLLPATVPVVIIPRLAATQELWKQVPPISRLCE